MITRVLRMAFHQLFRWHGKSLFEYDRPMSFPSKAWSTGRHGVDRNIRRLTFEEWEKGGCRVST